MIEPRLRSGPAFAGLAIGLLGGSFNPAHDGHLAMSLYALKALKLDQIWWLVSPQNPLKPVSEMASFEKRFKQARRFISHPQLKATDIEQQLGTNYTADTLRGLKKRFPHVRFIWLMGADNLRQIPRWKEWNAIFKLVPVAVFRRPAYPSGRTLGKAAIKYGAAWRQPGNAKMLAHKNLPIWILMDNKLNYTSATNIRKDTPKWQD